MASEKLVEEIREISKDSTSTPVEELISNPDWGKLNFNKAKSDLDRAFKMFNDLLIFPIDLLPDRVIESIIDSAKPLQGSINRIKTFYITSNGYTLQNRDGIITTLKSQADHFYIETQQWIPYLVYQKSGVQQNINELTNIVNNVNRTATSAKEEIQSKKDEIDGIVTTAKEASASVGVAHFTADFSSEASTLDTSAKWWLGATGFLGVSTLIVAIIFFRIGLDSKDGFEATYIITTKLIILGVLFSATAWCGKIYKALMHQVTINKHRANAIRTFQAFTKAASDDVVRDAVLKETTKSIFDQRPTGYLDKETDKSK